MSKISLSDILNFLCFGHSLSEERVESCQQNVTQASPSSGGLTSSSQPCTSRPASCDTIPQTCPERVMNESRCQPTRSAIPVHVLEQSNYTPFQDCLPLDVHQFPLTTHSRPPWPSPRPTKKPAIFDHAQNFTVSGGTFTNSVYNSTAVFNTSSNFMKELLGTTILGAAFDSSARDPPPRCHPGTRLAILERCINFVFTCIGAKKILWVVGAAGVGKSAIMQSVAESTLRSVIWQASIFFFVMGRNDGTKAIMTLVYQLAVKCEPYRQFVEHEVNRDPSLLHSSMSVQFKKFIVEPIIDNPQLSSPGRILIIIDGLDECDRTRTQRELLRLISDFCLTYPSSPVVWMIGSRPEPHIASFFAQDNVKASYEKEEILVESDQARADVERFLHIELTKIQTEFSLNPRSRWPSEQEFWKLANASGGLFVFAQTVIKYIGDRDIGNPTLQLNDLLKVIDTLPLPDVPQEQHPMAHLDALYAQILSKVPSRIMANTRKLLLALVLGWVDDLEGNDCCFVVLCNWFGITCDDAYAAIRHLRSVLIAPERDEAHEGQLRAFHKSFIDYISDFTRSGFFPDINHEARQFKVRCTFRVLGEAPDGVDLGNGYHYDSKYGHLARGPGTGSTISLSWPTDKGIEWDDNITRLDLYKTALSSVVKGVKYEETEFCNEFCIRLLATRFELYDTFFPFDKLQELLFGKFRCDELIAKGILKQMPAKAFNMRAEIDARAKVMFRFRRPVTATHLPDPWNPSCDKDTNEKSLLSGSTHSRKGEWEDGKGHDWMTSSRCGFCYHRMKGQLGRWMMQSPGCLPVLVTSTGKYFVQFRFVEPEDGISEWTYWLVCDRRNGFL